MSSIGLWQVGHCRFIETPVFPLTLTLSHREREETECGLVFPLTLPLSHGEREWIGFPPLPVGEGRGEG